MCRWRNCRHHRRQPQAHASAPRPAVPATCRASKPDRRCTARAGWRQKQHSPGRPPAPIRRAEAMPGEQRQNHHRHTQGNQDQVDITHAPMVTHCTAGTTIVLQTIRRPRRLINSGYDPPDFFPRIVKPHCRMPRSNIESTSKRIGISTCGWRGKQPGDEQLVRTHGIAIDRVHYGLARQHRVFGGWRALVVEGVERGFSAHYLTRVVF